MHLRDMMNLPETHPDVATKFNAGHFTAKKTKRAFSAIAIDQAHEQNNAYVKGDGSAIGLTENPSALRRWMVAGPEIARVITEFESSCQAKGKAEDIQHHEQMNGMQIKFDQDVRSLVSVLDDMGNPFEEDNEDLMVLDTKEIMSSAAVSAVRAVQKIGQDQFESFVKERLVDVSKPLNDVIKRNKFLLFTSGKGKSTSKSKQQLAYAKNDSELFSRLYIACQTRDGNLEEFFKHENRPYPLALSQDGQLRFGTKADLLECFEQLVPSKNNDPQVTSVILNGAAIVHMLKPRHCKTFIEYASEIFVPYILSQLRHKSRLDLVWDNYAKTGSLAKGNSKRQSWKGNS